MKVQGVFETKCVLLCTLSLLGSTNFADSKGLKTRPKNIKPHNMHGYNVGEVLSYHSVVSLLQCEDLCLRRQPQCLGFNYHFCEEERLCQLLGSIGETQKNDCATYVKFHYGKVQKRLLQGCSCSERTRRIIPPNHEK